MKPKWLCNECQKPITSGAFKGNYHICRPCFEGSGLEITGMEGFLFYDELTQAEAEKKYGKQVNPTP